jgi:hypothetical protein
MYLRLWGNVLCIALFAMPRILSAAEGWVDALASMPLKQSASQLNSTNCVETLLGSLQSNAVVKALIFMPGATDELYLFHRAKADLTNRSPTLLDAVIALTNQTRIQASFHAPLLLLHTEKDLLEPEIQIEDALTAQKLKQTPFLAHLMCNDADWDFVQPLLKASLRIAISPWRGSRDSWHFYRHSFAVWGLNGEQALETVALAGKTKFAVRHKQLVFELDSRIGLKPTFDAHTH